MSRTAHLARLERERLSMLERRAEARAERRAVEGGIAETVSLSRGRGAKFAAPDPGRGEREGPYRRLTGLDWLARKGRVSEAQKAIGERYGLCWRLARAEPSIGSTLDVQPGGGLAKGAPLGAILAQGEARAHAQARLNLYRRRLRAQPALVAACDLICGEELTPREAAKTEREVARLEAVLEVALDLLASGEAARASQS
jgi:hypothetical protein